MKTYRIKVGSKVYEMDISVVSEEVYIETQSGIIIGERLPYSVKTEVERIEEKKPELD